MAILEPIWQNKGLSCVENYVLYALHACAICPEPLYYQSGLPVADIARCLENGETYAMFSGVDRLQHIARRLGLLEQQYTASPTLADDLICTDGSYALVCVTPAYIREAYHEQLWRDDHYILLTSRSAENTYSYINDRPFDQGELTHDELRRIYNGAVIRMRIKRGQYADPRRECLQAYLASSETSEELVAIPSDLMEAPGRLRDLLLIWKTLRYRLTAFGRAYLPPTEQGASLSEAEALLRDLEHRLLLLTYRMAKNRPLGHDWQEAMTALLARDRTVLQDIHGQLQELWERQNG